MGETAIAPKLVIVAKRYDPKSPRLLNLPYLRFNGLVPRTVEAADRSGIWRWPTLRRPGPATHRWKPA